MKLLVLLSVLFFSGCAQPPEVFQNKILLLDVNETATISALNISVTNKGCGRQWVGSEERVYCDVVVKTKDSTYYFGQKKSTLTIKNIKLEIEQMNPWGKEEDSIPPGGCRILVSKLPDIVR